MTNYSKTAAMMQRGTDFLGCETAILCGAMSWVSERNLVSAISNAGGFGVIACGAMTPELLDTEIAATKEMTDKPFGVNLITMHPQLFDLIAVCKKYAVSHVVLAGGIPPKGSVEAIKEFGGKVIVFAPTLALAKKLLRSGGDALVIEGMEAGGHIGPVSTSVLAQEFLPELSQDYDVRTMLMSYRYFFAWVGGLAIQVMLFAVFLQPSEGDAQGFQHIPGWNTYGLVAAIAIFSAIAITALGTHHRIPNLQKPPAKRALTLAKIMATMSPWRYSGRKENQCWVAQISPTSYTKEIS